MRTVHFFIEGVKGIEVAARIEINLRRGGDN